MIKCFTSAAILTLISLGVKAQYNYKQRLSSFATIALPDSPKVKSVKDLDIYFSNYNNVFFMAQASHLRSGLQDLLNNNNTDSIYNSYIKGTLESTKGQLFYKGKLAINHHEGIEFGYKAPLNGQETYRNSRAVYLNDTILVYGIWAADSLSKDDAALLPFFNGFKIKSVDEVRKAESYNNSFKIGQIFGYLLSFIIVISIGLGVVFILKRITYGKKASSRDTELDK